MVDVFVPGEERKAEEGTRVEDLVLAQKIVRTVTDQLRHIHEEVGMINPGYFTSFSRKVAVMVDHEGQWQFQIEGELVEFPTILLLTAEQKEYEVRLEAILRRYIAKSARRAQAAQELSQLKDPRLDALHQRIEAQDFKQWERQVRQEHPAWDIRCHHADNRRKITLTIPQDEFEQLRGELERYRELFKEKFCQVNLQ